MTEARETKLEAPKRHSGGSGSEVLIDIGMRDYLAVREDMWGLRRLSTAIFTGVIAAAAVALSAIVILADKGFGSATLPVALLAAALLLELASIVLIGIDGSFKIVEDLNRRQASDLRRLLERISAAPVPDSTLRFQDRAHEISPRRDWRVWVPSYGAWGIEGLILPFLAAASIVSGVLVASSNGTGLSNAALLLLAIDVVVGLAVAALVVLDLRLPGQLEDRHARLAKSSPGRNRDSELPDGSHPVTPDRPRRSGKPRPPST
jgi:hypothetical protein